MMEKLQPDLPLVTNERTQLRKSPELKRDTHYNKVEIC